MRSTLIDITSEKKESVLELYEILNKCSSEYNVRLYEPEHVNALSGWVPYQMESFRKALKTYLVKSLKLQKKDTKMISNLIFDLFV